MSKDNVSDLPVDVDLDLDLEERPDKDRKPPLRVRVEGRVIEFKDPEDADWQDLMGIDNPYELLRIATTPEDRQFIRDQEMPGWKFGKLIQAYSNHYELDEKLARARRQAAL